MTMANSIELRVPLLDHQVLEFAAALPDSYKLHGFPTKYLFKKALRERIPEAIPEKAEGGVPGALRAVDVREKGFRDGPVAGLENEKQGVFRLRDIEGKPHRRLGIERGAPPGNIQTDGPGTLAQKFRRFRERVSVATRMRCIPKMVYDKGKGFLPDFLRTFLKKRYWNFIRYHYNPCRYIERKRYVDFGSRFRFSREHPYRAYVGENTNTDEYNVWNAKQGDIVVGENCWFGLHNIVMGPVRIGEPFLLRPLRFPIWVPVTRIWTRRTWPAKRPSSGTA